MVLFSQEVLLLFLHMENYRKTEKFAEKLSIINVDLKDTERTGYNSCWDNENNLEVIKKEIERIME